jgi:DNA-binding transcriptional MerR regulator
MPGKEASWTIQELAALAALALATGDAEQPSGRVREVPDLRTIRYYTTLGLLDRPAEWRGRTALYGRRHLLQLVAIKRLQAGGLSLVATQERLLGLPDRALARLARVPPEVLESGPPPAESPAAPSRRAEAFWKAAPAPLPARTPAAARPRPLQALDLEPGAMLLLSSGRALTPGEAESLREAAGPLLERLRILGLLTEDLDDRETTT